MVGREKQAASISKPNFNTSNEATDLHGLSQVSRIPSIFLTFPNNQWESA